MFTLLTQTILIIIRRIVIINSDTLALDHFRVLLSQESKWVNFFIVIKGSSTFTMNKN